MFYGDGARDVFG